MSITFTPSRANWAGGAIIAGLAILGCAYALQVFTPLRLNTDAMTLLSVADSVAHGRGFLDEGQPTVFPPGYPAYLALLLKAGLAHPWAIVATNIGCLAAGLGAFRAIFLSEFADDPRLAWAAVLLSLLSFVIIKHATLPLTDVPFLGFSMGCLALLGRARTEDRLPRLVLLVVAAWALAVMAILVRRNGVALLPALLFAAARHPRVVTWVARIPGRVRLSVGIAALAATGLTLAIVAGTSTLSDFVQAIRGEALLTTAAKNAGYRLTELGELFCNAPISKFPTELKGVAPAAGAVLGLLAAVGLAVKRKTWSATDAYFVSYAGILAAWPFYDTRFWLPVAPLLVGYAILAARAAGRGRTLISLYAGPFAAFGVLAIAYSTWISLAGAAFPDRYGDGGLRPTYCAAMRTCAGAIDPKRLNVKALRLIEEFT